MDLTPTSRAAREWHSSTQQNPLHICEVYIHHQIIICFKSCEARQGARQGTTGWRPKRVPRKETTVEQHEAPIQNTDHRYVYRVYIPCIHAASLDAIHRNASASVFSHASFLTVRGGDSPGEKGGYFCPNRRSSGSTNSITPHCSL